MAAVLITRTKPFFGNEATDSDIIHEGIKALQAPP